MSPFKPRHRRLALIAFGLLVIGVIVALVLNAFRSNLVFFYTPTQVMDDQVPHGRSFRIGGMVERGSVQRSGLEVSFRIGDGQQAVPVVFRGALPDLFKEGQGAVAQGQWREGRFHAREVLAKHDENYMPPEAAAALAAGGRPAGTLARADGPMSQPQSQSQPEGAAR